MSINTISFIQPEGKIKNGLSRNIHKKKDRFENAKRNARARNPKMENNATVKR